MHQAPVRPAEPLLLWLPRALKQELWRRAYPLGLIEGELAAELLRVALTKDDPSGHRRARATDKKQTPAGSQSPAGAVNRRRPGRGSGTA